MPPPETGDEGQPDASTSTHIHTIDGTQILRSVLSPLPRMRIFGHCVCFPVPTEKGFLLAGL